MDKIAEAREILKMLGMPIAQQADICCYALLAMAGIRRDTARKLIRVLADGDKLDKQTGGILIVWNNLILKI